MKNLTLSLIAMILTSQAHAAYTLSCYDTYSKSETPLMTAKMASNTTLRDVKFAPPSDADSNDGGAKEAELKDTTGTVTGTMVVSNHSPYKGDILYLLNNGLSLILPASLVNSDLDEAFTDGIGIGGKENGVIIGTFSSGDSEGGNHFSYRLKCVSDK